MSGATLRFFKKLLTKIGARSSAHRLHQYQMIVNYMKLGRWMNRNNFHAANRLKTRNAVFASVADIVRDKDVLYLEFGVFQGASMRFWSQALRNPSSKLHGFDSFEGLPEDFDVEGPYMKGTFDVGGKIPDIPDERVQFFKGWFEDSLPQYQVPEHDVLVLVLDADLYSSTKFVLNHLKSYIKPGTYIYFDDMSRPDHEPKALEEFIAESGLNFELFSTDVSLNTSFFKCV